MVMMIVSVLAVVMSMNVSASVEPSSTWTMEKGIGIEKIVFASDRSGNWDIWMMNPDGTELEQLTTNPAGDYGPALSPDGTKVAFYSNRAGNPDIYVLDLQAGVITPLTTDNPESDSDPTWSNDSSEIAFASRRGGYDAIWNISASGGTATQVTFPTRPTPGEGDACPDWSPNGNHIVFQSTEGHKDLWAIWEVSVIDGTEKKIIAFFGNEYGPAYSPDGTRIVWTHWLSSSSSYANIWLVDADGNNREQLTFDNFCDQSPDWSPDGTQIVFQSNRNGGNHIWVINTDGSGLTQLTSGGSSNSGPNWGFIKSKPPIATIITDSFEYCTGDTVTVTLDIANPTSNPVTLEWYIGVPQSDIWVTYASASIPAGFENTYTIPIPVGDWGPTPFGLVHYVHMLNPVSGDILVQDVALCVYSPGVGEAMAVDIEEEIIKTVERVELPI